MNREERERLGDTLKPPPLLWTPQFQNKPDDGTYCQLVFVVHIPNQGDVYWCNFRGREAMVVQYTDRPRHQSVLYTPDAYDDKSALGPERAREQLDLFKKTYMWYSLGFRLAKVRKLYTGKY
jgi:hypothetical protein